MRDLNPRTSFQGSNIDFLHSARLYRHSFLHCHATVRLGPTADDGSTAVEVALKMAFRAFMQQHQLDLGSPQEGSGLVELQMCRTSINVAQPQGSNGLTYHRYCRQCNTRWAEAQTGLTCTAGPSPACACMVKIKGSDRTHVHSRPKPCVCLHGTSGMKSARVGQMWFHVATVAPEHEVKMGHTVNTVQSGAHSHPSAHSHPIAGSRFG
eukprot:scaffold95068_cov18-Tisochrysis_lutea.AAC.1